MQLELQPGWKDYELLDSGNFRKLERLGGYVLIRPEPQAIWNPKLSSAEWQKKANAEFVRPESKGRAGRKIKDVWNIKGKMPERWPIRYTSKSLDIQLEVGLTPFGHIGLFPEQVSNWEYIARQLSGMENKPRVLNLFAYTGAASLVAAKGAADVFHVDAAKPNINWANRNAQLNDLEGIHWVLEDAFKFAEREARRGNSYAGIIMDPPPFGRGTKKEKWTLQERLSDLVETAAKLLRDKNAFLILNTYASGLSSFTGYQICRNMIDAENISFGEIGLEAKSGNHIPSGHFVRLSR